MELPMKAYPLVQFPPVPVENEFEPPTVTGAYTVVRSWHMVPGMLRLPGQVAGRQKWDKEAP
jgi:hypothetical protein